MIFTILLGSRVDKNKTTLGSGCLMPCMIPDNLHPSACDLHLCLRKITKYFMPKISRIICK